MNSIYRLIFTERYLHQYKFFTKDDVKLRNRIVKSLKLLSITPQSGALHSHKVNSRLFDECWSSRVTGDLRIIWKYDQNQKLVILVLDLGKHEGKYRVYA